MNAPVKPSLPAPGRLEVYIVYGALGAIALALVLLIAFFVCSRRCRDPVPVAECAIVHTPWSRLKNMGWAIATSIAGFLITRSLAVDNIADRIIQLIAAALNALLNTIAF